VTPARLVVEGAAVAVMAKARALRGGTFDEIAADLAKDDKLAGAALRIARQLGEMKGAAMKLGQVLSFVDIGLVPEQYRGALEALQADAPPMPFALVEQVVEEELGAGPDALFDFFSRVPIASASIGQVHMAHCGDEELVVKVQYPGVVRAVEADLRNAALLALLARVSQRLLADLVGNVDTKVIIDELRERVTEELDYRIEARNQADFAALFAGDDWIDVPDVVPELSTQRVITSRYVDGMRWKAALEAPPELRDRWGQAIARFQWVSLFRHGITNLDPHPGNFLFHEDGRVTFVDFGACQRYDESQLARLAGLVLAARSPDDADVVSSLVRLGLIRDGSGFDHELLVRPVRLAIEPALVPQPFTFSRDFLANQVGAALTLRFGRDEIRLLRKLEAVPELAMVLRYTVGCAAVLSQLGATVHFQDVLDEALTGHPGYVPFAA
jgi:predicted unusual protein kinase regulating ubiquinone biosynthesis (AarF/ABC1/UbiB family)